MCFPISTFSLDTSDFEEILLAGPMIYAYIISHRGSYDFFTYGRMSSNSQSRVKNKGNKYTESYNLYDIIMVEICKIFKFQIKVSAFDF